MTKQWQSTELRPRRLATISRDARRSAVELQGMIGAQKILKMLNDFATKIEPGKEPTKDQLVVAMFLINKVIPNLASMKVTSESEQKLVVFNMPATASSSEAWEASLEEQKALAAKPVNGNGANGHEPVSG